MLRIGRVNSVDGEKHTVTVTFTDVDGEPMVSGDLHVFARRRGDYSLPEEGDLVGCAMDPGPQGVGFVLGVLYSDSDAPPTDDAGARVVAGDPVQLGDETADKFVALANLVKDRLDSIQQTFDAHIHTTTATVGLGGPGVISPPTSPIGALADVAAEKVTAK